MAELHFYPGQNILAVLNGGKVTKRFVAYGGPEHGGSDQWSSNARNPHDVGDFYYSSHTCLLYAVLAYVEDQVGYAVKRYVAGQGRRLVSTAKR